MAVKRVSRYFFLIDQSWQTSSCDMSVHSLEHQCIDYQPGTQNRCPVEEPEPPWFCLFAVLVYFIKCTADEEKRQYEEYPAIAFHPYREGKSPQAETGQDKGQLSAERIHQRRGNRTALQNVATHRSSPLRLLVPRCLYIYLSFAGELAQDKDNAPTLKPEVPRHLVGVNRVPIRQEFHDLPFYLTEPVVKETSELRGGIGGKLIGMTDR